MARPITVTVVEAMGLPDMDQGFLSKKTDKTDAFVQVQVGKKKQKTRTIKDDLNPKWNQRFSFEALESDDIVFRIYDDDFAMFDDFIGQAHVPAASIGRGPPERRLRLVDKKGKPVGELFVRVEGDRMSGRPSGYDRPTRPPPDRHDYRPSGQYERPSRWGSEYSRPSYSSPSRRPYPSRYEDAEYYEEPYRGYRPSYSRYPERYGGPVDDYYGGGELVPYSGSFSRPYGPYEGGFGMPLRYSRGSYIPEPGFVESRSYRRPYDSFGGFNEAPFGRSYVDSYNPMYDDGYSGSYLNYSAIDGFAPSSTYGAGYGAGYSPSYGTRYPPTYGSRYNPSYGSAGYAPSYGAAGYTSSYGAAGYVPSYGTAGYPSATGCTSSYGATGYAPSCCAGYTQGFSGYSTFGGVQPEIYSPRQYGAAASVDAADGIMDGRYFGNRIL